MDGGLADYTFITAIARGWGIALRCGSCGHEQKWTDIDLEARFLDLLDVEIAAVVRRLKCGCGAKAAKGYYFQCGSRDTGDGAALDVPLREAELRIASERRHL